MSRQHIDFKVTGADKDSGDEDVTAIKPIEDGEPGFAAVFKRPAENLRTRTETIRADLDNLRYLTDADRELLLASAGNVTWAGLPAGTFTVDADLTLKPFLAPAVSTPAKLLVHTDVLLTNIITIATRTDNALGQPRAYNGANKFSFDFTPSGILLVTQSPTDPNEFHVQYDPATTTNTDLVNALTANVAFTTTKGLVATLTSGIGVDLVDVQTAVGAPPVNEQLTRFLSGAADAEKHIIPIGHFAAFFIDPLNALTEGDVLAISYDDLVMASVGGRRQSINEGPEFKSSIPVGSLFLLRRFPERLPLALPLATVLNGKLIFINRRVYSSGETGPLVASDASYQGSPDAPDSWADGTVVAGIISFEQALDTVIQTLGTKTTLPSGSKKVGYKPAGNISGDNVEDAITELDTEKAGLDLENTFLPAASGNRTPIIATGKGRGRGVRGTGGTTTPGPAFGDVNTAVGLLGFGGVATAIGIAGYGGNPATPGMLPSVNTWEDSGVIGVGTGTIGSGVFGVGAAANNAAGVHGEGSDGANTLGVVGIGKGTGAGVTGSSTGGGVGVSGTSATTNVPAVLGTATAGTTGIGVKGVGFGAGGAGVRGEGGASNGAGVVGYSAGGGVGVFSTSATGAAIIGVSFTGGGTAAAGVMGVNNDGPTAVGLLGKTEGHGTAAFIASGFSGMPAPVANTGVQAWSQLGSAVNATNANAEPTGKFVNGGGGDGVFSESVGVAIHGKNVSGNYAIHGESANGGAAVRASGTLTSRGFDALVENNYAALLENNSATIPAAQVTNTGGGTGIRGLTQGAAAGSAVSVGVHGKATSGTGVRGDATGSGVGTLGYSPAGKGVRGESDTGDAVYGESASNAIHGVSSGAASGVYGEATAGSGVTYGVAGRTSSAGGVGGQFVNDAIGVGLKVVTAGQPPDGTAQFYSDSGGVTGSQLKIKAWNPVKTAGFANTITPRNVCKAWGTITWDAKAKAVLQDGFNIDSVVTNIDWGGAGGTGLTRVKFGTAIGRPALYNPGGISDTIVPANPAGGGGTYHVSLPSSAFGAFTSNDVGRFLDIQYANQSGLPGVWHNEGRFVIQSVVDPNTLEIVIPNGDPLPQSHTGRKWLVIHHPYSVSTSIGGANETTSTWESSITNTYTIASLQPVVPVVVGQWPEGFTFQLWMPSGVGWAPGAPAWQHADFGHNTVGYETNISYLRSHMRNYVLHFEVKGPQY